VQRVLASILTIGAGLWAAAAPAFADTAPPGTLVAQPNTPGAASHLLVDAKGTGAGFGAALPSGVTLALFKGFALDLAAAGRCSDGDAAGGNCPTSSRIATGMVSGTASLAGLFAQPVTAPISVFLAGSSNGDLADVVVEVTVQGTVQTARGQLVAVSDPVFGYEFHFAFDPLPAGTVPVGTTVTLGEFTLDVGASATGPGAVIPPPKVKKCRKGYHHNSKNKCVKNKKKKKKPAKKKTTKKASVAAVTTVTHNLFTNPTTCTGSWPTQLRVTYPDHTQTLDAAIACSP
jgi:hypothetical protein